MRSHAARSAHSGTHSKTKDSLDHIRAGLQELHAAISDAAAKREGTTKADLTAFGQKVKTITESAKGNINSQGEAAKKHLQEAVDKLELTQKHIDDGLKTSGQAFQTSAKQVLADARASVQKVSEAIAAKRSAESKKTPR